MDREKVIKELEERIKVAEECMGNPMFTPDAIRTIIALLKEQEAELSYREAKSVTHTATKLDDATCTSCGNVVGEKGMIIITTMKELPDHCYDCPCHNGETGQCRADADGRYTYEYRPYWCPLTEVNNDVRQNT